MVGLDVTYVTQSDDTINDNISHTLGGMLVFDIFFCVKKIICLSKGSELSRSQNGLNGFLSV